MHFFENYNSLYKIEIQCPINTNKYSRLKEVSVMDLIRILFSIFIPPVGVFLQVGLGLHFWINILLTLLGYFPGLIHAICVIIVYGDPDE